MTEQEIYNFKKEHKGKTFGQIRLELLKFSKDDVYDYLEWYYEDLIHGWRQKLSSTESILDTITTELKKIKEELSDLISYMQDLKDLKDNIRNNELENKWK